jgi:hypothetical protein
MIRATVLLLALTLSAYADTVTFRNGTIVTGTWLGIDGGQIKFQVNDQIQVYPRSDVSAVTFGEPAPEKPLPPLTPPPPPDVSPGAPVGSGVQEPEKIGAVYLRDPTGKLVPLERVQARWQSHRSLGVDTVIHYWEIEGATSPVRLKSSQEMLFVVKLASGIDPSVFQLFPLARKKDTRRIKNDIKNGTEYLTLPLDVKKYGESSYSLTPANALAPGEYSLSSKQSNDGYCFGVDPP